MAEEVSEDERTTELSTIAAIFPELIIDPSDPYHATLELAVTPLKPLRIRFEQPVADSAPPQLPTPPTSVESGSGDANRARARLQDDSSVAQQIEHLPSLKLDINLPEKYPADDPPRIHLLIDLQWLPRKKIQELEADCARLWEEFGRDQVVFSYIDYLQQQSEDGFGLVCSEDYPVSLPADLKLGLLDFNLRVKREKFEAETFDCGICLEPKKGKDCHRLSLCSDVFCTACLTDFYTNCITEGDVDNVKCLAPTCAKDVELVEPPRKKRKQDRTLNPSELLQIPLSQDLVQRYVRLKRKKKLESSKKTIYCPRQWCQGPAYPEHRQQKAADDFNDFSDSEDDASVVASTSHSALLSIPMEKRLAICSDCNYAFCLVCCKTWHGSHSTAAEHCNPRSSKELAAEEQASLDYLKRHSTPCPTCAAPAQKTMGCNHMICFRCNTHFCYLCSSFLMNDNPYKHFNDLKSPCYMRLWELEGGDGEGAANNWAGVVGEGVAWDEDLTSDDEMENGLVPRAELVPPEPPALPPVVVPPEDDDTSDEEPAPDIRRRERAIEFVNFANPDRGGRRVNIPDREIPEREVPPAAPEPARNHPHGPGRGRGQQANWQRRQQNEPPHNRIPRQQQIHAVAAAALPQQHPAEDMEPPDHDAGAQAPHRAEDLAPAAGDEPEHIPRGPLPRAAPGQNNNDAANPAPARAMGLERFLELARLDAEDEWDSDELDEDDEGEWDFDGRGFGGGVAARANAPIREGRIRGDAAAAAGIEARMARREGRNHFGRRGL